MKHPHMVPSFGAPLLPVNRSDHQQTSRRPTMERALRHEPRPFLLARTDGGAESDLHGGATGATPDGDHWPHSGLDTTRTSLSVTVAPGTAAPCSAYPR